MCWERRATLTYGPLLLTRSRLCGNTEREMFESETVAGRKYEITVAPATCEGVNYAFDITFKHDTGCVYTRMCDYASGTNIASFDEMKLFNIFI